MMKKCIWLVALSLLLAACSASSGAEQKKDSQATANQYETELMKNLNLATATLYSSYYMKQQNDIGSLEEVEKDLAGIDDAVEGFESMGDAPNEELERLHDVVGNCIAEIDAFISYAIGALCENDPAFLDKYNETEGKISPYLLEINEITSELEA